MSVAWKMSIASSTLKKKRSNNLVYCRRAFPKWERLFLFVEVLLKAYL